MKVRRKYRIKIEDESRLRQIVSVSIRPHMLWIAGAVAVVLLLLLASVLIMSTPLRTLLPGYLKKGERTEAEEGLLRIDSIREAYQLNSIYITNLLSVLDTDRTPTDSTDLSTTPNELPPDSLLPASPREIEFINRMKDREQFDVSFLAPIAADQLRIYPVGVGAIAAEHQSSTTKLRLLTPKGTPVCAVTDGRVLAVQNPAPEGGCAIVMQHDNGFASRYSHIGTPAVAAGSQIAGGSVIAHGATGGATTPGYFFIEMWHDGFPLEPARYLSEPSISHREEENMLLQHSAGR